jgi:signal transduction histidine kinase
MPVRHFVLGVGAAFAVGLALFYLLMRPAIGDLSLMTLLMAATAAISITAAYAAYRLGWIVHSPNLRWTLMGGYALAGLLVFLNVWVAARMMFTSDHDLLLATILLVFATGIALAVGFFLSNALVERIRTAEEAAKRVASGNLDTRLEVAGRDEMASLSAAFNDMVIQLQSAAQKKQELEVLRRDLIAWVGHDLRTPLTSIRAIIEALADGVVEDPAAAQRYLRTAQQDVQALSHLIDDLFELAQLDAGGLRLDVQPGSLSDLISDTIESFSEQARRQGVVLSGSADSTIDPLPMDVQRIGRVLTNLVANALRHTPAGGSILLSAKRMDDAVQIEVRDSGEGIRPEDLDQVFERFYRGEKSRNRATGGAGLGLAIARGIVEAHGGKIWAESKQGEGARFIFYLPTKLSR